MTSTTRCTSNLIYVFGFVLTAAFLLLLFTFRSIVVPIKAILLNLLSVAAAYGAMVLVFQHGWFKSLLGFSATGPIVAWLPLFLFVVLFGLSMDYHVFILTRVREGFDRGMTTKDAVASATKSTAGVVTSAAIVMVCVFSVFATLSLMDFKQLGVGLAVAVFIDATLISGVLLPATMTILGDRNWWLPRSLGWLPHVAPESGGDARPGVARQQRTECFRRPPIRRAPVVVQGPVQGRPPMTQGVFDGTLQPCRSTSSTTATVPTNAQPRSPRGRATPARCVTTAPRRPASPADTPSGGRSRPVTVSTRSRCCRSSWLAVRSRSRSATSRSPEPERHPCH